MKAKIKRAALWLPNLVRSWLVQWLADDLTRSTEEQLNTLVGAHSIAWDVFNGVVDDERESWKQERESREQEVARDREAWEQEVGTWEQAREEYKNYLDEWIAEIQAKAHREIENMRVGHFDSGKLRAANAVPYRVFNTTRMGHIGAWIAATGNVGPGDKITVRCFTYTSDDRLILTSVTPMGPGAHEIPFDELKGRHAITIPEHWAPWGGRIEVVQDLGAGMDLEWACYVR